MESRNYCSSQDEDNGYFRVNRNLIYAYMLVRMLLHVLGQHILQSYKNWHA